MKYRDENGVFQELYFKATDTLPVGTEVEFEGDTAPWGWEFVDTSDPPETATIRKTEQTVGVVGNVVNESSGSTKDTYSCGYLNELLVSISELSSGSNINNLAYKGFHLYAVTNATGTLPSGYTSSNRFFVQTLLAGDSTLTGKQLLFDANSDRLFVRTRNASNSTWNSWVEVNTNIKITSGTASPSGGSNGDIYFKYS